MTLAEYTQRMEAIYNGGDYDEEQAHIQADALMCELLRALGCEQVVEVYEKMSKYYA